MLKCAYKPNRSHARPFTPTDAARVMCLAISHGIQERGSGGSAATNIGGNWETAAQNIVNLARARCGDAEGKRELSAEEIAQARSQQFEDSQLQTAYDELVANGGLFLQLLEWFGALLTFLTILIGVARIVPVPQIRLVAAGASRILTRVTAFEGAIIARSAANDAAAVRIRTILEIRRALKAA